MWLNEYLYYYYYSERAIEQINADEKTRGEEVLALNKTLLAQLQQVDIEANLDSALAIYYRYNKRRESTYMHYAQQAAPDPDVADTQFREMFIEVDSQEGEGYAGVALDIMSALVTGEPCYTALNVPQPGRDCGYEGPMTSSK